MRNFAQFGNNTGEQITEDIHLFNTDCAFLIKWRFSGSYIHFFGRKKMDRIVAKKIYETGSYYLV